jgi:diguanylate cyclase (GGDEF)-like protein/PAS domain S-box-containing protein
LEDLDLFSDSSDADQDALQTARTLADSEQHLGTMLELMPIGVLVHSQQGIVFANQQASTYFAAPASQLRGQHLLDFVAPANLSAVQLCIADAFASGGAVQETECALERRDSTSRLMKIKAARLPWQGTPVIQVLMQDITDQKRAETSLRQMTITDELTGAYNRRHANYEAHLYLDTAQSENLPFSVVSVDIDHFKSVNDTYGHDVGDLVLKGLAQRAAEFLATKTELNSAIFARMGGEEFLFLLPGTTLDGAVRCADQFREAIAALSFNVPEKVLKVTLSAGAACYRSDDGSIDKLLKRADTALYAAKAQGRNQVIGAE